MGKTCLDLEMPKSSIESSTMKETNFAIGQPNRFFTKLSISNEVKIETSPDIDKQLMVCSHERSGTHYLMNTVGMSSAYCADPWLNYDTLPLGSKVNFYSKECVRNFIKKLSAIDINNSNHCNASIIKSHYPTSHLGNDTDRLPLKIIYIYRNPFNTLVSYWRMLHHWNWNEGPKTASPLILAKSVPSGQSQRYQATSHKNYFTRWASHVIDGIQHCNSNSNAFAVCYDELVANHQQKILEACNYLNIELHGKPGLPSRSVNVINGKNLKLEEEEANALKDFCRESLEDYPLLKSIFGTDESWR